MLLIVFCGYFCSFCKLNSPKLLSQLKNEEFELNLVLQIRNQRKEKQKIEEIGPLQNFAGLRNISQPAVSQVAKFSRPAFQLFAQLTLLDPLFVIFPKIPLCNSGIPCILVILLYLGAI